MSEAPDPKVSISLLEYNAMTRDLRIADDRIEALERDLAEARASRKRDCVAFFRWWWNQPGNDTEAGYDQWEAEHNEP